MSSRLSWVITGSDTSPCCCDMCCLYPWPGDLSSPFYPPESLPVSVLLEQLGQDFAGLYINDPGTYNFYFTPVDPGSFSGVVLWRISPNDRGNILGNAWQLYGYAFGEWTSFTVTEKPWYCLFDIDETESSQRTDPFEDTYLVNGIDTISRITPCKWTGSGWTLNYGISNPYKWSLNGIAKIDPQDGPIGTYGTDTVA
jgi:hypothetical protein